MKITCRNSTHITQQFTDAAPSTGFGAFNSQQLFSATWPPVFLAGSPNTPKFTQSSSSTYEHVNDQENMFFTLTTLPSSTLSTSVKATPLHSCTVWCRCQSFITSFSNIFQVIATLPQPVLVSLFTHSDPCLPFLQRWIQPQFSVFYHVSKPHHCRIHQGLPGSHS